MAHGVRRRLFVTSMALLLVVGAASGLLLERQLRTWLEGRVDRELEARARAVAEVLAVAGAVSRATETAIDGPGDGRIAVLPPRAPAQAAPDVRAALRGRVGHDRRYDPDLGAFERSVAVPVRSADGRVLAVVRAAMPLAEVDAAVATLRKMLAVAAVVGLAVAAFMSWLASTLAARALRSLAAAAQRLVIAPGDRRVPTTGAHELAHLAGSFNTLSGQLRDALDRLASERDRLEAVLDALEDAVVIVDDGRKVVRINAAARRILGAGDVRPGAPLVSVLRNADLLECVGRVAGGGHGVSLSCTLPGDRKVLARVEPLRRGGGAVVALRDVTDLVRMERARRDLVANVSHELRTPVAIVRANAETLADGGLDDPEAARQFVDAIHRNAIRLADLLDDLLDLARLEARDPLRGLAPRTVRLSDVVDGLVRRMGPLADGRGQRIEVDLEAADLSVHADPSALDQVLSNLLDNALRHGAEGGQVWIRARRDGDTVLVSVEDDGPGIDPRHRPRIFERFYRADEGRTRAAGGAGLGLAIVKHLVTAMGGEVSVDERKPHGARFTVRLPGVPRPHAAEGGG